MKYCGNCGKPVNENADYCLNCGCFLNKSSYCFCTNCGNPVNPNADICVSCGFLIHSPINTQTQSTNSEFDELLDIGLLILSIVFPIIGFIIGAVKRIDDPLKAKRYTKAASISLAVEIAVFAVIVFIFFLLYFLSGG